MASPLRSYEVGLTALAINRPIVDASARNWQPLSASLIHQPWSASPLQLKAPAPIIDHRIGRERALKACAKVRAA
jgi:hypothetical protein